MKPTKRNLFLDFVKAFAIILVVVGHNIQCGSGTNYLKEELFFDNIIFKYIYSFHMPLFMLISGYFFAYGINKEAKDIFINKFKSLIVPILTWAIVPLVVFISVKFLKNEFSIISTITYYISYSLHSLWFLWAVFWCSLIVLITNKMFKDNILIYILIFTISFFIPDVYNLALYKFMFPYFVIGYLYKKYNLQENLSPIYNSNYFVCLSGVIFFILLYYFERNSYIYVSKHTILNKDIINQLSIDFYRYFIGFIGSIFTLSLLFKIYNIITKQIILKENHFLLTIGKNTMGIYIISNFINLYILNKVTGFMKNPNYFILGIESVLVILVSILIIRFIQQYKILNKFLLGAKG